MQLVEFIRTMLGFQAKVEGHFTAAEELNEVKARIGILEGEAKSAKDTLAARDASILELQGKLASANSTIATKDGEIATLQGQVQTEKGKANSVIAAQGLHPSDVPAAEATKGGAAAETETAWEKYNRLQATDAREAGRFYATNAEKIFSTRPK